MKKIIAAKPKKLSVLLPQEDYEIDFYKWTKKQAAILKNQDFSHLDIKNLIEEIISLGISDKRSLKSHLIILLQHLLKKEYQPGRKSKSWDDSINHARLQIELIVEDSPSLKKELNAMYEKAYSHARQKASEETGLDLKTFPNESPWKLKEVL